MAEIEVEGKTVEDAIKAGLAKLDVTRDRVEIKILSEGTSGLFGLMGTKPARVRLTTKEEEQPAPAPAAPEAPAAPAPAPAAPAAESGTEGGIDYALVQERAREVMKDILDRMGIGYTEVHTALMGGRVLVDVKSEESSLLIGKNGHTLEALETILNLILSREPQTRTKVTLDTEEYRVRQEERLQAIAHKGADFAKRTGKLYRFDPMNSKDRRIVHLALKSDPDIETFSEGEGQFRKVVAKPKKTR